MGCVAHACTALRQRVFGQAAANFGRAAANSPPFVAIAAQCAASTHRCYQRSIRDGRCRSMRVALRSTQKGFPPSVGLPQSALLCRPRGRRCLQGPPAWREEEEEAEAGGGCCYSGRLCGRLRLRGGQRGQRPGGQAGARGPARCTATRQRRRRRGARAAWVWRCWEHLRAASGLLGIFGGRAGRGRSMGDRRMAGGAAAAAPVSSCQGAPRADGRVQQTSLPAALARATGRPAHDTPPSPPPPSPPLPPCSRLVPRWRCSRRRGPSGWQTCRTCCCGCWGRAPTRGGASSRCGAASTHCSQLPCVTAGWRAWATRGCKDACRLPLALFKAPLSRRPCMPGSADAACAGLTSRGTDAASAVASSQPPGPPPPPPKHAVQNKPLVKRVLLLAAHGVDKATWEAADAAGTLPAWRSHLGQPVELQARNATLAPGQHTSRQRSGRT